jgi:hypothetical protein
LPVPRNLADDAIDLRRKSHVEHSVGLVEHEHFEVVEDDVLPLEMIDETPGRRDDHVHPAPKRTLLRLDRHPAEHRGDAEAGVLAVLAKAVVNLRCELAGWRQDENSRPLRPGKKSIDDREGERGCLAGAGVREADEVAAVERERNGFSLDWRGVRVTGVAHRGENCWIQSEVVEADRWFGNGGGGFGSLVDVCRGVH